MGLLDDAIREHLELKRRHGADAAEVARLEQEALGPARRTPSEDAPPAAEAAAPAPAAAEAHAPIVEDDYVFEGHEEFEEAEPPAADPASAAPVADEPEPVEPEPVEPEPEVPPAAAPAPPPPAPPAEDEPQATVEFEPGSEEDWADDWDEPGRSLPSADATEAPAEPQEEAEDVLEETPDFLQETPEHDRLWFEQKPPRDFDF